MLRKSTLLKTVQATLGQGRGIRLTVFVLFFLSTCMPAFAQTKFRGILYKASDSSVIPYAAVSVTELGLSMLTGEHGEFSFAVPKGTNQFSLNVFAIGCKKTIVYTIPNNELKKIYLDVGAQALSEFALRGMSAEEVVIKAIASIPANYADTSYFDHSFYRRYQRVNNRYTNLMEASPVVMFKLNSGKHGVNSKEAFAVSQVRRSNYHPNIMNEAEDNPVDLLEQNAIYHLHESSLDPGRFYNYRFRFDTNNKTKDFVINYVCLGYSTDHHGIQGDFALMDLNGEAWDSGMLVIDRESYAIKTFSRFSHRYFDYKYKFFPPQNNRLIYDGRYYFFEFTGGDLEAEYQQRNGKWYLSRMARKYTNEFYIPVFGTREYEISDHFEWYSDTVSRYTTAEYFDKFYTKMATAVRDYDAADWLVQKFPFHYAKSEAVFTDLEKDGPVLKQFYNESKIDDERRISRRK